MKQIAAALEFGTSKVVCLIGEHSSHRTEVIGMGSCDYAGYSRGRWNEPEALEETIYSAVREAELQARRRVRSVFVGVPGSFLRVVSGRIGVPVSGKDKRVSQHDVERLLQAAEKAYSPDRYRALHRSPLYFMTDGHQAVHRPVGMRAKQISAVMSYTLADMLFMKGVTKVLSRLGLQCEAFVATSAAVGSYMLDHVRNEACSVVADVGYLATDVSLYQGRGLVFHETIPIGGGHITSDIAYCLGMSADGAEKVKRRYVYGMLTSEGERMTVSDGDRVKRIRTDELQQVVEARSEELFESIRGVLATCGYLFGEDAVLYLTGGGVNLMRGVRQFASSHLDMKVKLLAPSLGNLDSPLYTGAAAVLQYGLLEGSDEEQSTSGMAFFCTDRGVVPWTV